MYSSSSSKKQPYLHRSHLVYKFISHICIATNHVPLWKWKWRDNSCTSSCSPVYSHSWLVITYVTPYTHDIKILTLYATSCPFSKWISCCCLLEAIFCQIQSEQSNKFEGESISLSFLSIFHLSFHPHFISGCVASHHSKRWISCVVLQNGE